MTDGRVAIQPWRLGGTAPQIGGELLVFSIATPATAIRDQARQQVRQALREILAPALGCLVPEVPLLSSPGQPLQLDFPGHSMGLSVSHEVGLSLFAINPPGPVGVDLLKLEQLPLADEELLRLATDYLGPETAHALGCSTTGQRRQMFALAWAKHEASLKCLGEGLREWSPPRQAKLAPCRVRELALPEGWAGAVAVIG
ncbi:MAG: 4'-phosphopantetheinyl transferase family protein [Bacteroidota bacterium]